MKLADSCSTRLTKKAFLLPLISFLWSAKNVVAVGLTVVQVVSIIKDIVASAEEKLITALKQLQEGYKETSGEMKEEIAIWYKRIYYLYNLMDKISNSHVKEFEDDPNKIVEATKLNTDDKTVNTIKELEDVCQMFLKDSFTTHSSLTGFIEKLKELSNPKIDKYDLSGVMSWLGQEAEYYTFGNKVSQLADSLNGVLKLVAEIKTHLNKAVAISEHKAPEWQAKIDQHINELEASVDKADEKLI